VTILLNVCLDKSLLETLFLNKQYVAPDGSERIQYVLDKRIYPGEPFDSPIFTFIECRPDAKTAFVLKMSMSPRLRVSRVSTAQGGLTKLQINAEPDVKQVTPPLTLFLAKTGLPLDSEKVKTMRQEYTWGYECRLLSQPDKIIAYLYAC
jgi:hypothetical protein